VWATERLIGKWIFNVRLRDFTGLSINSVSYIALYCLHLGYSSGFCYEDTLRRLKLLLPLAVLLSPGLILVGLAQGQLTIDASKQPSVPARGRGPFPGARTPGHSASLPVRLELRIPNGPLQPDGTTLVDFVITNVGTETMAVPSSLKENGPSSDILTLWFTSDAVKDAYFKDSASGQPVNVEIVPTSAELYGRRNDPHSFILVAPNQSVKVHASSRVVGSRFQTQRFKIAKPSIRR
jgi:hypothetical protein